MTSTDLQNKIIQFKKNFTIKDDFWVYEQNNFDLFLDEVVIVIAKITKLILNNKYKVIVKEKILKIINSFIDRISSNRNFSSNKVKFENSKINKLDQKIDDQYHTIQNTFLANNQRLRKEISVLNLKIDQHLKNNNLKPAENLGHNSSSRVDFYQEENVRLGAELMETKKKFEILKNEIEKYEEQRSNLISKINSVNDALNDTNVLTNVFSNDVKPKVNVIDHKKIENKSNINLNEQVKNIFSNKN
tara:strand:+ start:27454 stop:28191 length:738 start_codon:yes stop_codon:yes gene_type:complete